MALEQQSTRIVLLVQHLEDADSAMKVLTLIQPMCSPDPVQEHTDVSESLGRRLREESEVNAALSQVSIFAAALQHPPHHIYLRRSIF